MQRPGTAPPPAPDLAEPAGEHSAASEWVPCPEAKALPTPGPSNARHAALGEAALPRRPGRAPDP